MNANPDGKTGEVFITAKATVDHVCPHGHDPATCNHDCEVLPIPPAIGNAWEPPTPGDLLPVPGEDLDWQNENRKRLGLDPIVPAEKGTIFGTMRSLRRCATDMSFSRQAKARGSIIPTQVAAGLGPLHPLDRPWAASLYAGHRLALLSEGIATRT